MSGSGANVAGDRRWLVSRSLRSFRRIDVPDGGLIVAQTGAWLRSAGMTKLPPGGRFIGVGLDRSPASVSVLRRHGGDFGLASRWRLPFKRLPPVCYFAPELAAEIDAHDPAASAWRLLKRGRCRLVHLPQLDVHLDERLRVIQVVTTLQIGGAERVALELAAELNDQEIPTLLVALGVPGRATFPSPGAFLDLSQARDRIASLLAAAAGFGADLVHAHLLAASELRALSASGPPVVITLHNTPEAWPRGTDQLTSSEVALVLACSRAVEERVSLDIPCRTVWNGIRPLSSMGEELRTRYGVGPDDVVLVALANVRPQKRFELLGDIFAAVRQRLCGRRCHLWVAGQGTEQMSWPAGTRAFGLLTDAMPLLRSADVLLCPSRHEGLSLVQLEALALGKQVVATRVGGAPEVPGLALVEEQATAEDFAQTTLAALAQPPPSLPPSFTLRAMADRYAHLYRRALAPPSGRGGGDGLWLVTNNLGTGGAQSSARRLVAELNRRGMRVRVATVQESSRFQSAGRTSLERTGVRVWCPPDELGDDAAGVCEKLLEQLDVDPPSTVFFWNLIASYKVMLADALLQTAIFDVSPGEMNFESLERYFARPRTGLPYTSTRHYGRRLAGAVVKYKAEKTRAEEALRCPVHVIPNGVAAAGLSRQSGGAVRFVTAARLSPDKRLEELLQALRLAQAELPRGCMLHVAGGVDGEQKEYARQLRRLARGLPVRWHGHVRNVPALLAKCDVFVMISEPAGCPNASLEAMAAGLPVVATDHGGASEQVIQGVTGFLTPRNQPGPLSARMVQLATDAELRLRLGRNAREHVASRFSVASMADAYARLIR